MKRLGIFLLIIGVAMLGGSYYINYQVEAGKIEISGAQKKVDTGNAIFSGNPYTKAVGEGMTSGAQRQIDAGQLQVNKYEVLAAYLKVGGIICAGLGIVLLVLNKRKRRK